MDFRVCDLTLIILWSKFSVTISGTEEAGEKKEFAAKRQLCKCVQLAVHSVFLFLVH